jgi:hypothetical protein
MNDPGHPPAPMIPPGSTATRELLAAIRDALAVPRPVRRVDEISAALLSRQRSIAVAAGAARLLDSRDCDDADVMAEVTALREATEDLPVTYREQP